jgi:hypothetical protein
MTVRRLALIACAIASPVSAAEIGSESDIWSLEVHAFVSQGFLLSTANDYLAKSHKGSFEFSEMGVNFTKPLADNLRVGLQLFVRDLGPVGNYSIKADWYYLDYHWRDWLGFRAGRVKLPFGLYNDSSDVDSARVPILLPQSVYPIEDRDFLLAQTGVEVYGYYRTDSAGAFDYRAYAGTIFLDTAELPPSPYTVLDLTIPYVVGARLMWETPLEGLRIGGSVQNIWLDTTLALTAPQPTTITADLVALLWVASVEYSAHDWLLASEYTRWRSTTHSSDPALIPESTSSSERAYVMVSYRVNEWFQPGAYYSLLFPNVDDRSGRENQQHDVAATLRFDFTNHWLLKLEAHYMNGTAALSPAANDNTPQGMLTPNWGFFLMKTTAYF